jgi:hypothetical protein
MDYKYATSLFYFQFWHTYFEVSMDFDRETKSWAAVAKSLIALWSGSETGVQFLYGNTKRITIIPRIEELLCGKLFIACVSASMYRVTFNCKTGVSERSNAKTPMNCPIALCAWRRNR